MTANEKSDLWRLAAVLSWLLIAALATDDCRPAHEHSASISRGEITCFSDGTVDMRNMDISGPGFDKLPRMEVLSRLYRVLCAERAI